MKKFSRMPKSESGGLGGASGSGSSSGVSSYFGKVFAVGRYQVTVEELVAEGMYSILAVQFVLKHLFHSKKHNIFWDTPVIPYLDRITHTDTTVKQPLQLYSFYGLVISLHSTIKNAFLTVNICLFPKK